MVALSGKRLCIDTNIYIYFFQKNVLFGNAAKQVMGLIEKNQATGISSTLVLAELLAFPMPDHNAQVLRKKILGLPNIFFVDVDSAVAWEAGRIRRMYNMKMPDAVVIATALCMGADMIVTNDAGMRRCKELPTLLLSEMNFV